MSVGSSKESVYVSFHFLEKGIKQDDGSFDRSPFSKDEFSQLVNKIKAQPEPDLDNKNDFDGLKFGRLVPFLDLEKIDERTLFGRFRSAYWGHSYENTEKGKIAADSLNLRDFCFLLYHSEDGCFLLGCQYLGNYGDYTSLSKTLMRHIGLGDKVRSRSFFSEAEDFKNSIPQEVRVTLSSNSKNLASGNDFGTSSMLAFKKTGKDDTFELTVRDKILSLVGQPEAAVKQQVAALLSKNELFSVADEDIQDCVVTVRKEKSRSMKTIYLFGQSSRATKFHLDVQLDTDGLPVLEIAKKKMLKKLDEEIISKVMDG